MFQRRRRTTTNIDAIRDAGVTTGCALNLYCPKDFVTREQMAAFLNRLGALQAGKTPVVNADKLDGLDSADFAQPGPIVEAIWGPLYPGNLNPPTSITGAGGVALIAKNSAGDADVLLPLSVPLSIGGVAYGWSSVEACFGGLADVTLNQWIVFENGGDGSYDIVATDSTDHSLASAGCFSLNASAYPNGIYDVENGMGNQVSRSPTQQTTMRALPR